MARKNNLVAALILFLSGAAIAADNVKPFPLADTGEPFPIDYAKYGTFNGVGTDAYKYKISDRPGLAKAMGAGIYPNVTSLAQDPAFSKWKAKNPGNYNQWDYVNSGDAQNDFYIWANAKEVGPGTKLLFTGKALAEGGHYRQALKAFHAVLVHFPREAAWSADHSFVWYVANEALGQIQSISQEHPEIGMVLKGARWKVTNGGDTDLNNDVFVIAPGKWEKRTVDTGAIDLSKQRIIRQRGYGKVRVVQYANKHWQLIVIKKPMIVHGITYNPVPIGQHISNYNLRWMFEDEDGNGETDSPYDSWIDANRNNQQDANEPAIGDFELMKRMGVNAIRIYRPGDGVDYDPRVFNKKVMRDMYNKYGISIIMADFLGAYTVGSGANWEDGTDYTDPVQLENMRRVITDYVRDHKSEPYVLMWLLGNENLMPSDYTGVNTTRTQASKQVKAYLSFVNEIADLIHRIDPDHPVAVGNLDLVSLDDHKKYAPSVDIFGANAYRGSGGFGTVWEQVAEDYDRPVLITEFGCDAWDSRKEREDEEAQANYHKGTWKDIMANSGTRGGQGNAIGGVVFEFIDEWWKSNQGGWDTHENTKDSPMSFPDGWSSEEWFGMVSRGDGTGGSLLRRPRAVYNLYKDTLWK